MVTCQWGLAWCIALDTAATSVSSPAWSLLPLPLEVEVHPVEVLRRHELDERCPQPGPGGGVGGHLVQGRLVEARRRQHHPVTGAVGAGDEVGQGLALVARPIPGRSAATVASPPTSDAEVRQAW